jgi:hypothetical protein
MQVTSSHDASWLMSSHRSSTQNIGRETSEGVAPKSKPVERIQGGNRRWQRKVAV